MDITKFRSLFFGTSALLHAGLAFAVIAGTGSAPTETVEVVIMEVKGQGGDLRTEVVKPDANRPKPIKKQITKPVVQKQEDSIPTLKAEATPDEAVASTSDQKPTDSQESSGGRRFGTETGAEVSAQQRYMAELRSMLERRKEYPLLAKRLRQQGKVIVRFILSRDGKVMRAEVIENSEFDSLNRAAEKLITSINGLKPFPEEVKKAEWTFVLPVEYRM